MLTSHCMFLPRHHLGSLPSYIDISQCHHQAIHKGEPRPYARKVAELMTTTLMARRSEKSESEALLAELAVYGLA